MTEKKVKELLKSNNLSWDNFNKWMRGQTLGAYPDMSTMYYSWDVERQIEWMVKGTPTYFDQYHYQYKGAMDVI